MNLRRIVPAATIATVAAVTGGLLLTGTGSAATVNRPAATNTTAPGPTGIFVSIAGIPGSSTVPGYSGQVKARAYSWGLSNGNGRTNLQDFSLQYNYDISGPALQNAVATATTISSVVITEVHQGKPYLTVTLTNAQVSSFSYGSSGSGATANVTFTFQGERTTFGGTSSNVSH